MDAAGIAIVVGALAAPVAAFVTWFFNRKKYVADIYSSISESSQTAVETMQLAMKTLHDELADAQVKIAALSGQIITLQQEIIDFRVGSTEMLEENRRLKSKVYELSAALAGFAKQNRENKVQ